MDLLDSAGLAAVCEIEDDEVLLNATARTHLQQAALSTDQAMAILECEGIVPLTADPGILVWERRSEQPSRAAIASLSRREREVSRWLERGKSARDIAAILGISPRTVEKHIQNVYAKYGVRSHTDFLHRSANEDA